MSDSTGNRIITEKHSSDALVKEKRSVFPNSGLADKISNRNKASINEDIGLDLSSEEDEKPPPPPLPKKKTKVDTSHSSPIEINVIDPATKKKETFRCEKNLLLKEMKFFDMYNKEAKKSSQNSAGIEDLDITIQCQITLFRWLMKYIRNKTDVSKINYKNVH